MADVPTAEPSPARPYPHCGGAVTGTQSVCPNCGTDIQTDWPPTAGAEGKRATDAVLLSDRKASAGFGSGCLLSVPFTLVWSLVVFLLGTLEQGDVRKYHILRAVLAVAVGGWLAMMLTIYLRQRPRHPGFARGFGYSLAALLIFLVSLSLFCGGF